MKPLFLEFVKHLIISFSLIAMTISSATAKTSNTIQKMRAYGAQKAMEQLASHKDLRSYIQSIHRQVSAPVYKTFMQEIKNKGTAPFKMKKNQSDKIYA